MKTKAIAIAALCSVMIQRASSTPSPIMQHSNTPEEAFEFIATATNHWGVDASAAKSVFLSVHGLLRFPFADCDQSPMCDFFCIWMDKPIPQSSGIAGTNLWIDVKCDGMLELLGSRAVCNNTNCWMAVAREYGRISEINRGKWHEFLELDKSLMEERPDGTIVINAPVEKRTALCGRPWMTIGLDGITYVNAPTGAGLEPDCTTSARDAKEKLDRCQEWLRYAFHEFTASATFAGMNASDRNAIVSNLVEAARFTPEEAASLGLTNIVETAGTRLD